MHALQPMLHHEMHESWNEPWARVTRLRRGRHKGCALTHIPFSTITAGVSVLSWTIIFLIIALVAGLLGFFGVAGMAATIAKICFLVFLVLFVVSLFTGRTRTTV